MIILPSRGTINFKDETRRSGTWLSEERFVVVPKSRVHAGDADHTRMIVMYLTDSLIGRFSAQFGSLDRIRRRVRETSFFAVTPEIRTLQYLCFAGDPGDKAVQASRNHIVSALLIQVLAQIERSEPLPSASSRGHGDGVVAAIRSFIESRLAEDLPLNLIADKFGLSRRHTTRLFRRWTGLSIAEYQERQRIRAAHKLLTDTTLPVGEIAWRLGYESGSALARAMRRVTGHSPSAVRGRPDLDRIEAPDDQ